jgi:hypothetical protein
MLLVLALGISFCRAAPGPGIFEVRQFGARGDGKTLDTVAIQAALDACGKAGGGLRIKSNPAATAVGWSRISAIRTSR